MRRRRAILAAITAAIGAAGGCGYPPFMFLPDGTGGTGGAATSGHGGHGGHGGNGGPTSVAPASGPGSGGPSSVSATGSGGGAPICPIGHVVISEIRTRGAAGASDEFVELYNGSEASVVLDGTWTLEVHVLDSNVHSYSTHWTGKGLPIPPHGHFLITGSNYADSVSPDDKLAVGITDAASMRLRQNGANVDVVCYYHANDPGSATSFLNFVDYDCAGLALGNPHNDAASTDTDASLERKPGGTAGNCTDTGNNGKDFVVQVPSTPEDRQGPTAP